MEKLERRRYDNKEHNWRVEIGESLCESLTRGGNGYDNSNFVDDLTLATSDWPNLIRLFISALQKGNALPSVKLGDAVYITVNSVQILVGTEEWLGEICW
jgi:hypothetical protein